ncbi:UDP-N-acetylmuramate dehydrogenase [Nigerium sp.]|uniref:UDP-N-acetylmuramate dehydrogenase n=1 Tax=Nigerium sp. TaxID=2042655 RepID=UPI003221B2E1
MTELLSDHTTFRVGGPVGRWVEGNSAAEIVEAVKQVDAAGDDLLVLSGGSNILASDEGFAGTVVHVASKGIEISESFCDIDLAACGGVLVTVEAGERWDDLVAFAVENELVGIEALSGIPGAVGSTPIQNVGAYGQEISQTLWSVRTWDRKTGWYQTFANSGCKFGYRWSRFKAEPGRYVVLQVMFQFLQGDLSERLRYGELARRLGVEAGQRAPMTDVRETVLGLRRSKGMVLNPDDHDTWSAGSFFTNPLLTPEDADRLPEGAPRFAQPDGRVKSSAAWLIEHAGFGKGYGTPPATLSTKHTLALTNRGGAKASDLVALARTVRDGVRDAFGVTLVPEPVLLGVSLD